MILWCEMQFLRCEMQNITGRTVRCEMQNITVTPGSFSIIFVVIFVFAFHETSYNIFINDKGVFKCLK